MTIFYTDKFRPSVRIAIARGILLNNSARTKFYSTGKLPLPVLVKNGGKVTEDQFKTTQFNSTQTKTGNFLRKFNGSRLEVERSFFSRSIISAWPVLMTTTRYGSKGSSGF